MRLTTSTGTVIFSGPSRDERVVDEHVWRGRGYKGPAPYLIRLLYDRNAARILVFEEWRSAENKYLSRYNNRRWTYPYFQKGLLYVRHCRQPSEAPSATLSRFQGQTDSLTLPADSKYKHMAYITRLRQGMIWGMEDRIWNTPIWSPLAHRIADIGKTSRVGFLIGNSEATVYAQEYFDVTVPDFRHIEDLRKMAEQGRETRYPRLEDEYARASLPDDVYNGGEASMESLVALGTPLPLNGPDIEYNGKESGEGFRIRMVLDKDTGMLVTYIVNTSVIKTPDGNGEKMVGLPRSVDVGRIFPHLCSPRSAVRTVAEKQVGELSAKAATPRSDNAAAATAKPQEYWDNWEGMSLVVGEFVGGCCRVWELPGWEEIGKNVNNGPVYLYLDCTRAALMRDREAAVRDGYCLRLDAADYAKLIRVREEFRAWQEQNPK